MEDNDKKRPKINFQILTPAAKRIKIPNNNILNAVPKSGWIITNTKGRITINNGTKRLSGLPILSNFKS